MKFAFAVAPLLFAGCVAEDAPLPDVIEAHPTCDEWMCGTNSPVIDGLGFHELNLDGIPEGSPSRFKLGTMTTSLGTYSVLVSDGRIIGTLLSGSASAPAHLTGPQLENAEINLVSTATTYAYKLQIKSVTKTLYWAAVDGFHPVLESYVINWKGGPKQREFINVCSTPTADTSGDGTEGMDSYHAVVFEGERIDAKAKVIAPTLDPRWFNIGCAGSTLAKLHLNAHTQAAKSAGFPSTTIDERQTMLKMLSGDYCGTGTPFTVAGMPLEYRDDHGTLTYHRPAATESAWDKGGATCLNTPRAIANPTALSVSVFDMSTFKDLLYKTCENAGHPLPTCPANPSAHLVSANPHLP